MERPKNLKVGDKFIICRTDSRFKDGLGREFKDGEILVLSHDDGTDRPLFTFSDGDTRWVYFEMLKPYKQSPPKVKSNIRFIRCPSGN